MGGNSYNNIEFDFKIKIIMKKTEFLILLNETLELENPELNEKSSVNLTVEKIIQLIGKDKFE
jgi:hypothetical protein